MRAREDFKALARLPRGEDTGGQVGKKGKGVGEM